MLSELSIPEIIGGVGTIFGAIMVIAAVIVKLTPSKKDDEVFAKVKEVVDPVVDAVDPAKKNP